MGKGKKPSIILSGAVSFLLCSFLVAAVVFARPGILKKLEDSKMNTLRDNLTAVLPAFDNEPWNESFVVQGIRIFPARREERVSLPGDLAELPEQELQTISANVLKGFAFEISSEDGEGTNPVWVGFDGEGELTGYRPFYFRDSRVPENFTNNIALQTPASRKISEAVDNGREFFEMHRNFFFAQAHEAQVSGETL